MQYLTKNILKFGGSEFNILICQTFNYLSMM